MAKPGTYFRHTRIEDPASIRIETPKPIVAKKASAVTECVIIKEDGIVHFGYAVCSRRDQFSKKRGALIARGRAEQGKGKGLTLVHPDINTSDCKLSRIFELGEISVNFPVLED